MDLDQQNKIIDRLGGTAATARLCEIEPPSVSEWRKYGIPRARLMFLRLARPDVFSDLPFSKDEAVVDDAGGPPCTEILKQEALRESQGGVRQPIDPKRDMT